VSARIRILDAALADQIAAGEVVERPASVVKELIENAVDAGARSVVVEIDNGGQTLIRVTDDGSGMPPADAALCVQRHATSKITSSDDLFAIRTLGFRGEALPSIASVSRFCLTTRPHAAHSGTRVQVDGGAPAQIGEHGGAPGTSVEVRDLFYNVPARLKFLKSKATESAQVGSVCLRAGLSHPELALRLVRDGRASLDMLRAASVSERVKGAFPDDPLITYEGSFEGVSVLAALCAPEKARSGAQHLHLFVNRRPIRDTALARAVAYAYGSVLPPGRFPAGVVYLQVDPAEVDVNVHPQKLEVRFARGRAIMDGLTRWLARQLGTSAWSGPTARTPDYWSQRLGTMLQPGERGGPQATRLGLSAHSGAASSESAAPGQDPWGLVGGAAADAGSPVALADRVADGTPGLQPSTAASLLGSPGFFGSLRVLGQARRMFLLCEDESGIHILDQHAADERVRYDRLRSAYQQRSIKTQRLLFPERVECSELEAQSVEEHHDELAQAGMECTRIGATTVAVAAIPALLQRAPPARLLRDILAELGHSGERSFGDALDMALATMACHGAIRAGDALSTEEIGALLRSLDEVKDFQGHCPHGRPVVSSLTFAELERRLGR
jgi:DNA mismatch repair protein MutL